MFALVLLGDIQIKSKVDNPFYDHFVSGCDTNICDASTELRPVHTAVTNLMDPEVFEQVLDVLVTGRWVEKKLHKSW